MKSQVYCLLLRDNFIKLDEEKVPQDSVILEGPHDVKVEFDECATDQSFMVHEDLQLDEVKKVDTMVLPMVHMVQDKIVPIPHIDLVIP